MLPHPGSIVEQLLGCCMAGGAAQPSACAMVAAVAQARTCWGRRLRFIVQDRRLEGSCCPPGGFGGRGAAWLAVQPGFETGRIRCCAGRFRAPSSALAAGTQGQMHDQGAASNAWRRFRGQVDRQPPCLRPPETAPLLLCFCILCTARDARLSTAQTATTMSASCTCCC